MDEELDAVHRFCDGLGRKWTGVLVDSVCIGGDLGRYAFDEFARYVCRFPNAMSWKVFGGLRLDD